MRAFILFCLFSYHPGRTNFTHSSMWQFQYSHILVNIWYWWDIWLCQTSDIKENFICIPLLTRHPPTPSGKCGECRPFPLCQEDFRDLALLYEKPKCSISHFEKCPCQLGGAWRKYSQALLSTCIQIRVCPGVSLSVPILPQKKQNKWNKKQTSYPPGQQMGMLSPHWNFVWPLATPIVVFCRGWCSDTSSKCL